MAAMHGVRYGTAGYDTHFRRRVSPSHRARRLPDSLRCRLAALTNLLLQVYD